MAFLIRLLCFVLVLVFVRFLYAKLIRPVLGSGGQPRVIHGHARKDPRCGIYVAEELAVRASAGGEEYYFCSTECRDRFLAQ